MAESSFYVVYVLPEGLSLFRFHPLVIAVPGLGEFLDKEDQISVKVKEVEVPILMGTVKNSDPMSAEWLFPWIDGVIHPLKPSPTAKIWAISGRDQRDCSYGVNIKAECIPDMLIWLNEVLMTGKLGSMTVSNMEDLLQDAAKFSRLLQKAQRLITAVDEAIDPALKRREASVHLRYIKSWAAEEA